MRLRAVAGVLSLLTSVALPAAETGATMDSAISGTTSVQGSLALALDGNSGRFFVAWTDNRDAVAGLDVYGRVLGPDGTPVLPEFPLVTAGRGQAFPALAFDGRGNRFLVAWTDWRDARAVDSDIYGRFMAADGTPEGDAFAIARRRVSQKFPAIAFDPTRQRFLIVWTDRRHGPDEILYARFLSADGGFLGPEFRIVRARGDQRRPSVVFDRIHGRFLVVWWDRRDAAIYAAYVTAPVTSEQAPIKIADRHNPRPTGNLAAAHAPAENRILVVWTREASRPEAGLDVYGILIDSATGSPSGATIPIATGAGREQSAVVEYDPENRRFLVVWLERRRNRQIADIQVYGRFVSADGDVSGAFLLSNPEAIGPKRSPVVAFSPDHREFLVLWEDGRNTDGPNHQIFGRTR